jgi:hypothetical protein
MDLLQSFAAQGWLRLEIAPLGRSHAEWLDHWRQRLDSDLAVFVDSDVEFRSEGWLRDLVTVVTARAAALVCAQMLPEGRNFVEPVGGCRVRAAARPAPWLIMLDVRKTAGVPVGFGFHKVETDAVAEGLLIFDVGAWFFQHLTTAGLRWEVMPDSYRRKFHHYGGLSWIPLKGERGRRKLRDLQTVRRRLRRLVAGQTDGGTPCLA